MLDKIYNRFGKRKIIIGAFALGFIIPVLILVLFFGDKTPKSVTESSIRSVELISVSEHRSGAMGLAIPSSDGTSFVVRAESGGRVNKVTKEQKISEGTIIAELDNGAQRAALLQAEGSYEAALAAAGISNSGQRDAGSALIAAKQAVVNTHRSALTSWTNVMYSTVDQLFSRAYEKFPSLKIEHADLPPSLSRDRGELNQALSAWQKDAQALSDKSAPAELKSNIDTAISRIDQLSNLVNTLIAIMPKIRPNDTFSEADLARISTGLSGGQASLDAERSALQSAKVNLTRAEEAVSGAEIRGTGSEISAANATIKQALGSYQAAQAAFNKTIVRAPFGGTLASLNVAVGDIVNYGSDVAIIVPEDGVETETSFRLPLSAVKYTPDGSMVFVVTDEGIISSVKVQAGLVSSGNIKVTGLTGEERIVLDVRGLKEGQKVNVK